MYRTASIITIFLLTPVLFVSAEHLSVPFCGDGIVEEGEKCIYDVGLTNQCWKEGEKVGSGNHYPLGEVCYGYNHQTNRSTGEQGLCIMNGNCWIGGEKYKDTPSRIVVMNKTAGLGEFVLIYIYDPGRGQGSVAYMGDAYVKEPLEGPDHYLANFCNSQQWCATSNSEGSSLKGDQNGKWNGFVVNGQPGVLVPVTDFSNWFEEEPSDEEKQDWYQTRPKINPRIPYFAFKQPGKYVLGIIDKRGNRVESEPFIVCPEAECETTELSGVVKDGHGFLVPDLEVTLTQETKDATGRSFTTYTDQQGAYSFNEMLDDEEPVRLTFTFKGRPDTHDSDRFLIYDEKAELGSTLNSPDQPVFATTKPFPINELPSTFDFVESLEMIESANIGDREQLDDIARTHYFVAEAMRFAEETLGVPMNGPHPLKVRVNNDRPVSFYTAYNNSFYLSEGDTPWDSYDKPDNNEWHEISHGIMVQSNIGGKNSFPEPRHPYGEWNHLGMANPGTTDSWVEGFATFLSGVMSYELEYKGEWEDAPWIYQYGDAASIHLDDNLKVWDSMGRKESFAVATLLWDFYDSRSMYGGKDDEDESLSIDVLWAVLNDAEVRDMKDVYDALSSVVPQETVDSIFISHGFYADENGDRKHEEGETIGTAANGGAFLTEYDFDRDGLVIHPYDVNTTVGEWLLGGTGRKDAPPTAYDDVPRWGSADIDGDGDIATLIMSPDGDSYESAVVDKDKDGDFGPLTDLDGDGQAEMTENPFWVLPFDARRSMMEFPEEMLHLDIRDKAGESVAVTYVTLAYEYDDEFAYRNYEIRALVNGDASLSIWVPEGATLSMQAQVGEYKSEQKSITYQEFFQNLAPRSDQGEVALTLPASNEEIVDAISAEKEARAAADTTSDEAHPLSGDEENGVPWWVVVLGLLLIGAAIFAYKRSK